ncbi:MAG: hypothetical protein JXM73_12070 [Anaerolineae bacterium]|nr:hypothetical protein [Anaerolineae bacterium]
MKDRTTGILVELVQQAWLTHLREGQCVQEGLCTRLVREASKSDEAIAAKLANLFAPVPVSGLCDPRRCPFYDDPGRCQPTPRRFREGWQRGWRAGAERLEALEWEIADRACPVCGGPVVGKRGRIYCSNACRQKAHRQRTRSDPPQQRGDSS